MIPHESGAGNPSARPKTAFWKFATDECESVAVLVLENALPHWCAAFQMARAVRGHPGHEAHKPMNIAAQLYRKSEFIPQIFETEEDFATLFATAWKKVRVLPGSDLLGSAVQMADAAPLGLWEKHKDDVTPGYKRFISFCAYLCVGAGSDLIKIPCREVGVALGVRKDTVSCYRQQAVEQSYLIPIRAHSYNPKGKGEATLFRFRVELWECLKGKVKASA